MQNKPPRRHHLFGAGLLLVLTILLTMFASGTALADTFTVTNTDDSGPGSLRKTITKANSRAGADEIVFADGASGTITLASTLPTITDLEGLALDGGGDVTVSGNDAVRVLEVGEGAKTVLKDLTIADGEVSGRDYVFGGSVYNAGTLTLIGSTIAGGTVRGRFDVYGGGIANAGTLTLNDSTVEDNEARGDNFVEGGGIFNDYGSTAKIVGSTVSGNTATERNDAAVAGGGIANSYDATLTVTGSIVSDNTVTHVGFVGDWGEGGGIYNAPGAAAKITDTTVSGNSAPSAGGGIFTWSDVTLEVTNSTFANNSASWGGGIYTAFGTPFTVTNSTFSANHADYVGGGIFSSANPAEVTNSTFFGNSADSGGGGIETYGGGLTLSSTILADSPSGGNCHGDEVTDGGYNVDSGTTCGFTQATGSLPSTDPLLDPDGLRDNGGPTKTIALLPDSPAVDLVGKGACPPPATDQRGVERPQGEACDSGAFELKQGPPQPRSKAECKKGGYKEFGFKSQGRCVAFVERAAKSRQ